METSTPWQETYAAHQGMMRITNAHKALFGHLGMNDDAFHTVEH